MTAIVSSQLIVGMEVHVELETRTKVFSRAPNPVVAKASTPNRLIDEVVLGLPGTLPVLNRAALDQSILLGLALDCTVEGPTHWDRKSYLYPDLPKGYQISQFDEPLCRNGKLIVYAEDSSGKVSLDSASEIRIARAHLEEDAGKLLHEAPGGGAIDFSIVDLNRAGTPLLEIVTEPDFRDVDQVVGFARQIRLVCKHLGISPCIMQEGQIRFEPNINMSLELEDGSVHLTPIVEIKNLNSFRALRGAIEHETRMQPERWLENRIEFGPGSKTTRGWDADRNCTFEQRSKEEAHDYRYFPEPDLPPILVDKDWVDRIRPDLVELPMIRLKRWISVFGMDARAGLALLEDPASCRYFDEVVQNATLAGVGEKDAGSVAATIILQAGARLANQRGVGLDQLGISSESCARLVGLRHQGTVSSQAAATILEHLADPDEQESDPARIARREGLETIHDVEALAAWVDEVIEANEQVVEQIRSGKVQAVGRLIGQVMQRSGGAADAAEVRRMLLARIGS